MDDILEDIVGGAMLGGLVSVAKEVILDEDTDVVSDVVKGGVIGGVVGLLDEII